jgi:hypothetical protein
MSASERGKDTDAGSLYAVRLEDVAGTPADLFDA